MNNKTDIADGKIIIKVIFFAFCILALIALAVYYAPWIIQEVKEPGTLRDFVWS
jgi:hypothetical protein